jgi:hypothetical protein
VNAKSLFQSNKELSGWWSKVVSDPNFDLVMLHATAATFENTMTQEQQSAVIRFRDTITQLSVGEEAPTNLPRPSLVHNLEIKRKTENQEPKK